MPKSFVFCTGKVGDTLNTLTQDLRRMMEPYTASNLKSRRKKNILKDYTHVASSLGVTHFLMLSSSDEYANLRIARVPRGPTLSFQVRSYARACDVAKVVRRPYNPATAYRTPPLVVLNNFSAPEPAGAGSGSGGANAAHVKLMAITFQNMFPSIAVRTVRLNECRRVVLCHLENPAKDGIVSIRHYAIRARPAGLTRGVKQLLKTNLNKGIPDLGGVDDVSELLLHGAGLGGGATSDSDFTDDESTVSLSSNFVGRGNRKAQQSAIKLVEVGPRLELKLLKVEKGLCEGDVLYHAFVTKTPEEVAEAKKKRQDAESLRLSRKAEQEANVSRKQAAKEEKKAAKKARREERERQKSLAEDNAMRGENWADAQDDDEAETLDSDEEEEVEEEEQEEEEEEEDESDADDEDDEDAEDDDEDAEDDDEDEDEAENETTAASRQYQPPSKRQRKR